MASTSERRGDDAAAKLSAASETAADTNFQSLRMTVETVERSMRLRGGQQRGHLKVASLGVVEDDSRGVHRSTIHERGRLEHDQPGRTLSERVRNGGHARLSRGVAAAASYKVGARPDTTAGRDLSLDEIDQDVEDQIQIAMANGDFDQLEGKGRPLARLSEPANPFVDDTERMGFKLMKQQGFVPDWIDRQQRIRKDMEQLVEQLAEAWYLGAAEPTLMYVARKDDFTAGCRAINIRVRDANIACPGPAQMQPYVLADEVRRAKRMGEAQLEREAQRAQKAQAGAAGVMAIFRSSSRSRSSNGASGRPLLGRIADAFRGARRASSS